MLPSNFYYEANIAHGLNKRQEIAFFATDRTQYFLRKHCSRIISP